MKRIMLFLALAFSALNVAFAAHDDTNPEVVAAIRNHMFRISVEQIYPQAGPVINSNDGYYLKIVDNVVDADMPYFGESHVAMVPGVDEIGMRFDSVEVKIEEDNSKAGAGEWTWTFTAKTGFESVDVTLTLFSNGTADIYCNPAQRTSINYRGSIEPLKKE